MNYRSFVVAAALVAGWSIAPAQEQNTAPSSPVIRSETRVVLVDAVVTDKKGAYVHDLTTKDFKVFEDNKEMKVTSFSFEADPNSPANSQRRYMVLFFDNSTMSFGEQGQARVAAEKFIDANAGPNRAMAIVNYSGSLQVAQNFTEDVDRLKAVVRNTKIPIGTSPVANSGVQLTSALGNMGARDMIMALRSFAKSLSTVPGRKTVILISSGFPLDQEQISEVNATIDVCNRSNVAIYPIDARGLFGPPPAPANPRGLPQGVMFAPPIYAWPVQVVPASFPNLGVLFQRGTPTPPSPGGGGSPGRAPSPPSGGNPSSGGPRGGNPNPGTGVGTGRSPVNSGPTNVGRGGGSNANTNPLFNPMNNRSRILMPTFPPSVSDNQQLLYMLANGTGGFVIANTNDLLGGMEKIGKEQSEYYLLGYTPPESDEGTCHELKVKVEHGFGVRARTGYCNAKPKDVLAGNSIEKQLEIQASASSAPGGKSGASIETPFFYTSSNVARVNVAMEISPESLKLDKEKGKLHGTVSVLGIAYRPDGSTAARFSDALKLAFENKKEFEEWKQHPLHYENQFDIASGKYTLKVVFSTGGESFGKVDAPLEIEPYDTNQFMTSSLVLSKATFKTADAGSALDVALLEDRTPLIVQGVQIVPAGSYRFKQTEQPVLYVEIYEPLLLTWKDEKPPTVAVEIHLTDRKADKQLLKDAFRLDFPLRAGNPMIPVGLKLSPQPIPPGSYRVEVAAFDQAGKRFTRSADFEIE